MQVPPSSNILQAISGVAPVAAVKSPGSAPTQTQQAVKPASGSNRGGDGALLAGRDPSRPLPRGSLIDILA